MKHVTFSLAALAILGGIVAFRTPVSGQTDAHAAPSYGFTIPPEYRDWRLISIAHEEGNLHSFAAVLGNDVAIKAYREGTLPPCYGTPTLPRTDTSQMTLFAGCGWAWR